MTAAAVGAELFSSMLHSSRIVELRQYVLHPGARDTLVALFDREFIEPQEELGISVIAQFRDLDRPNAFTWMRGFPDMESRARALAAFYDGPVWTRHKDAANATMIAWDNVRLLRPTRRWSGLTVDETRPGHDASKPSDASRGLIVATIYTLKHAAADDFPDWFCAVVRPLLGVTGGDPIATYETESSDNTFPRLPVREGERAFVWLARFADEAAHVRHVSSLEALTQWPNEARPALERRLAGPTDVWRLVPTARSRAFANVVVDGAD